MAVKGYSAPTKVPALLEPRHLIYFIYIYLFYIFYLYFLSYPRNSLGKSYPSVEMQSIYSAAPTDIAMGR